MNEKYLAAALKEYNMSIPASSPWFRFEQLSAAAQSRVEERALELELQDAMRAMDEAAYG